MVTNGREIPQMGMCALESSRMNTLQAALLDGDDDGARATAKDAAALFPQSPLQPWYAAVAAAGLSAHHRTATAVDAPAELTTLFTLATSNAEVDRDAVHQTLATLDDTPNVATMEAFGNGLDALAKSAPDIVVYHDQTLSEVALYAKIISAQSRDDVKTLKALAGEFSQTFPTS